MVYRPRFAMLCSPAISDYLKLLLAWLFMIPVLGNTQTQFDYIALDSKGAEICGTMSAVDEADAINKLRHKGYYPTHVVKGVSTLALRKPAPEPPLAIRNLKATKHQTKQFWFNLNRLGGRNSTAPLVQSLESIAKSSAIKGPYELAIPSMIAQIKGGELFSDCMTKYPGLFEPFVVNTFKAGELGGVSYLVTENILNRLESELEISDFPWFWCGMVFVSIGLMVFKGLISFNKTSPKWLLLAVLVVIVPIASITQYERQQFNLLRSQERLFGVFGTMLTSGVPIFQCIDITKDRSPERRNKDLLKKLHTAISKGDSVVPAFESASDISAIDIALIDVGEEAGQLPDTLLLIAESKHTEWQFHRQRFVNFMKWLMFISCAVYLVFLVASAFTLESSTED